MKEWISIILGFIFGVLIVVETGSLIFGLTGYFIVAILLAILSVIHDVLKHLKDNEPKG